MFFEAAFQIDNSNFPIFSRCCIHLCMTENILIQGSLKTLVIDTKLIKVQ